MDEPFTAGRPPTNSGNSPQRFSSVGFLYRGDNEDGDISLEPQPSSKKNPVYVKLGLLFVLAGTITTIVLTIRFNLIHEAAHWINHSDLGYIGAVAYLAMCIICNVLLLPQTPLETAGEQRTCTLELLLLPESNPTSSLSRHDMGRQLLQSFNSRLGR